MRHNLLMTSKQMPNNVLAKIFSGWQICNVAHLLPSKVLQQFFSAALLVCQLVSSNKCKATKLISFLLLWMPASVVVI